MFSSRFWHRHSLGLALLASALLHLLLLQPKQAKPVIAPIVIHAKLQQPNVKQPQLQPSVARNSSLPSSPPSTSTATPSSAKPARVQPVPKHSASARTPAQSHTDTHQESNAPPTPMATASTTENTVIGVQLSEELEAIDPLERSYQQRVLAHLRNHVQAPQQLNGSVRLELHFRYRQMVTQVKVIHSSGDAALDDWAIKAVFAANPFPEMPAELGDAYQFRPTLRIQ